MTASEANKILWFKEVGIDDINVVGGKNSSLGEMYNQLSAAKVPVPNGFAITTYAFEKFLDDNNLRTKIYEPLQNLDINDLEKLSVVSKSIRKKIMSAVFASDFIDSVAYAYYKLIGNSENTVAVRSSATAEDLPSSSFAGQQETFLNISGIDEVLLAIKKVYASLFSDRAIAYRQHHNFVHSEVSLSVGIQLMVRSDLASSGVMFTADTESGFKDVIFITSSYGLGESIVQGSVNPDEFYVYKPFVHNDMQTKHVPIIRRKLGSKEQKLIYSNHNGCDNSVIMKDVSQSSRNIYSLSDEDILILSQHAIAIEKHYQRTMDIEWAKDGTTGEIFILQARPETVKSRENSCSMSKFKLDLHKNAEVVATGRAVGQKIACGKVKYIKNVKEIQKFQSGEILVTTMTDPDWEPIMKRAAAIITEKGGRTCHAAIIARELGIPAVVGCAEATKLLTTGDIVTVSCAEGDTAKIYKDKQKYTENRFNVQHMPKKPCKIMLNIGNPDRAFDLSFLPNDGVGLARLEFIIAQMIGIHPQAILDFDSLPHNLQEQIQIRTAAYDSPRDFYVERLVEGISTIAAAFYSKKVIVRLSDFKSNEYANLLGGDLYEPREENPMLGFRGASRYINNSFESSFALECQAIQKVRNVLGFKNVTIMIPFVRTINEAQQVISCLQRYGLERGKDGLSIVMMCEIPANALLAEEFLYYFDGFSIGSNDLTQLSLGMDRDSSIIASDFDERNEAVKKLITMAILSCKKQNKYVGICGQAPSDYPKFAQWLVEEGIDSLSLNADSVIDTWLSLSST